MICIADTKIARRVGEHFIRHILKLNDVQKMLKNIDVKPWAFFRGENCFLLLFFKMLTIIFVLVFFWKSLMYDSKIIDLKFFKVFFRNSFIPALIIIVKVFFFR